MHEKPYTVHVDDGVSYPALPGRYRRMGAARRAALVAARETGAAMLVRAHDRVRLLVLPTGVCRAPEGMTTDRRTNCVRDHRTCFCEACRADRRAKR
jgi:hypothetical protein